MDVWIKLHSKILNWEWYKDYKTKSLFIHCLLKANWQDGKYRGVKVPRGSFITGRKKLSEELGMSEQNIKTALNHLKSTNEITIKSTKKFSIISINNYDMYQQTNQQTNQQLTNNQPQSKNIDIINNNYINKIEQNFGRTLAPLEVEMIERWVEENDDLRKIDYAIKETIMNGKWNLKYTNAILENIKNKKYEELINTKNEDEEVLDIPDYDWLNDNKIN